MVNFPNIILGIPTALAQTAATNKTAGASVDAFTFILENLPLWITAFVIIIISVVLGWILKGIVESRLAQKISEEHQEILIISGRLTFLGVVMIGVSVALAVAGINITNLLAAVGFGISFGLQDTISNFVAGISILASRAFAIGDWIAVDGQKGKVVKINIRTTYLDTYDGIRLVVPNSSLYKSLVPNYTSNVMRRMKVPAYTRYGINMEEAFKICLNVVKSHKDILLQPKPNVVVTDMGDYYIALQVRFWVDSRSMWRRIESRVFMEIQDKFQEAGIDSPYPTNALTFDTDDDQVMVKTHSLTAEEIGKIMKARDDSNEEFTARRAELIKPHFFTPEEFHQLDQSGSSFLKVAGIPNQAQNIFTQPNQTGMVPAQPQQFQQQVVQSPQQMQEPQPAIQQNSNPEPQNPPTNS